MGVFDNLSAAQWRDVGSTVFQLEPQDNWEAVVQAMAKTPVAPPMVNALGTAGIQAAKTALQIPREAFGGRHQQSAALEYPGLALFIVAIRRKIPRWVTELALAPLAGIGVDVEPFLPPASPDDEPMPAEYQN